MLCFSTLLHGVEFFFSVIIAFLMCTFFGAIVVVFLGFCFLLSKLDLCCTGLCYYVGLCCVGLNVLVNQLLLLCVLCFLVLHWVELCFCVVIVFFPLCLVQ